MQILYGVRNMYYMGFAQIVWCMYVCMYCMVCVRMVQRMYVHTVHVANVRTHIRNKW